MGRLSRMFAGRKTDAALRARIQELRENDPRAWAYLDTANDASTCDDCLDAADQLQHVDLRDPRLMVMLHGHPNCTSPEGCRCSIVVVAGHEPVPERRKPRARRGS